MWGGSRSQARREVGRLDTAGPTPGHVQSPFHQGTVHVTPYAVNKEAGPASAVNPLPDQLSECCQYRIGNGNFSLKFIDNHTRR